MNQFLTKLLRHYWLAIFVVAMGLLSAYTSSPIYGAPAMTPTPDVQTVPKPVILDTPTNTPFPTPTPSNDPNAPSGGGPVATRAPSDSQGDNGNNNQNDDDNNSNDNNQNDNQTGNQPGNDNPTPTSAAPSNGTAANPTSNTAPGTSTQTTGTTGGLTGVVNVVTLNMRKGPSTSDHIVDTLFKHDQVVVSGRDRAGAWWYVCCGAGSQRTGWVSAPLITPNFTEAQAAAIPVLVNSPLPVATKTALATPQTTDTAQATGTPEPAGTPNAAAATPLLMTMRAQPAFAWQGQRIQLQLVLRNSSAQALTDLHLQNDLPPELAFIEATISDGGDYRYTGAAESGPLLMIDWPALPTDAQVTATITLQIRADTPIGAVIDNLAAVTSAEGAEALAGLTLAMPPTGLPQFR